MHFYLFGSRILTHIGFWVVYYLFFGFIWARNGDYHASYFLEFILLPVRMLAVYLSIYWLVPRFLVNKEPWRFVLWYILLITIAGILQRFISYYFYETSLWTEVLPLANIPALLRNIILVNSTVLLLTGIKVFQLWQNSLTEIEQLKLGEIAREYIEVRSDKKIFRLKLMDILYLEGMGNYVTYYPHDRKVISYGSLNEALNELPGNFLRIHKSYIVNRAKINSYNQEEVEVGPMNIRIPVGRTFRGNLEF